MKDVGIGEMLPHPPPQKINVLLHGEKQAQVGGILPNSLQKIFLLTK